MAAIVRACADEKWDAHIVAVIGSRPDAKGLDLARAQGIEAVALDHKGFGSRDAFDEALARTIDGFQPDLIVLAGFMRILGDTFVRRFEGRLVNIHPSLLPAFAGLHTHRRALAAGCKLAGATVHFVSPELDVGPIVAQLVVPVRADDTEASLSARVLEREHVMYPIALRWIVDGLLRVDGGVVRHAGGASQLWL